MNFCSKQRANELGNGFAYVYMNSGILKKLVIPRIRVYPLVCEEYNLFKIFIIACPIIILLPHDCTKQELDP